MIKQDVNNDEWVSMEFSSIIRGRDKRTEDNFRQGNLVQNKEILSIKKKIVIVC